MSGNNETILDRLLRSQVLYAETTGDGNILLMEGCDQYYSETLTPAEVRQLVQELLVLADRAEAEK